MLDFLLSIVVLRHICVEYSFIRDSEMLKKNQMKGTKCSVIDYTGFRYVFISIFDTYNIYERRYSERLDGSDM